VAASDTAGADVRSAEQRTARGGQSKNQMSINKRKKSGGLKIGVNRLSSPSLAHLEARIRINARDRVGQKDPY